MISQRGIITERESIVVDPDEIAKYEKIEKERIYLDGEKWLVFTDFLTAEQKESLLENHEPEKVYRLSEEYLEEILWI
jgi:hypothetical protein